MSQTNGETVSEIDTSKTKKTYEGGATRSASVPDYSLIVGPIIERLVERAELGVQQHGRSNWLQSTEDPKFYIDAANHAQAHLRALFLGLNPDDDHLGAIVWNCMAMMHMEQLHGPLHLAITANVRAEEKEKEIPF